MLTDVTAVRTYFAKLGLEQEIADIYLALYTHGPQHIASLSRLSGVERTRIYRLIDKLLESNLVEVDAGQTRGTIKAAPISNLRILINQRAEQLKNLTDELELMEQVLSRNSLSLGRTRVQIFPGPEGLRQMLQNELNATEVVGFTHEDLERVIGKKFLDNFEQELKKRRITRRLDDSDQIYSCHVYGQTAAFFYTQDEIYGLEIRDSSVVNSLRYSVISTSRQKAT
jgi:sugar-specific transcriptional regulator TrmB